MTEMTKTAVSCPQCGAESVAEVWTSVNSEQDPHAAQWLIDGFLFQHECPECGNVSTLNHDCLFHDPSRRALVLYVANKAKKEQAESALEERREQGYDVRLVGTREALREKAALLRDGLDDRAVELCKFLVYNKFVEEGAITSAHAAYYGALAEDGGIIVEFVSRDGAEPLETTVPRAVYDDARTALEALGPDDRAALMIDRNWAANAVSTLG